MYVEENQLVNTATTGVSDQRCGFEITTTDDRPFGSDTWFRRQLPN